jgi:hypothetical protein
MAWQSTVQQGGPFTTDRPRSLHFTLIETLVSPMIVLSQYLFEALPREVPALSESVLDLGSERGILPLEPWLNELCTHLGYQYRHLPLYATRDVQLIPHPEVHRMGTDRQEHLLGLRPEGADPGLVFRVPRPWYQALGDATPATPARVCIFRHEHPKDKSRV